MALVTKRAGYARSRSGASANENTAGTIGCYEGRVLTIAPDIFAVGDSGTCCPPTCRGL
jgi:hypothetical protein